MSGAWKHVGMTMTGPVNGGLSVVLFLGKGVYPKILHAVLCPNKQRYFEPFSVFGSCFRMLAVILVSIFCKQHNKPYGAHHSFKREFKHDPPQVAIMNKQRLQIPMWLSHNQTYYSWLQDVFKQHQLPEA